jgi:hypothetical protein
MGLAARRRTAAITTVVATAALATGATGAVKKNPENNKALEGLGRELAASDERLRATLGDLQASLGARAGEAESALQRASTELRAEKVGRDDLAALLTEFALRLRGDFDLPTQK